MRPHSKHHVIHRQHRQINRRQTAFVYTNRNASGVRCWIRTKCGLCIAWYSGVYLPLAGINFRSAFKLVRPIASARRRCDGIRTNFVFSIKAARIRQSGTHSTARITARVCGHQQHSSCDWRSGSSRTSRSSTVGSFARRKTFEVARNTCQSPQSNAWQRKGEQ